MAFLGDKLQVWLVALVGALALAGCSDTSVAEAERMDDTADAPIATEAPLPQGEEQRILAFGDSLFAGYNVAKEDSYPAKLEGALRARGINARVINAGVSGDTSAAGRQRLTFILDAQERAPDLFILELGGNDLLRGLSPSQTRANLAAILDEVSGRGIDALIFGMRAPPNYGSEFQQDFDGLYPALAEQYDAAMVPFWVESVADKPELIQSDRIHPTEAGIEALVQATLDDVMAALPLEAAAAP